MAKTFAVTSVEWPSDMPLSELPAMLLNASVRRNPMVISGLPPLWPAMHRWSHGVCEAAPMLSDVFHQSDSPVFFHEQRDAAKRPLLWLEPPLRSRSYNVSCQQLYDTDGFCYVASPLSRWDGLMRDVGNGATELLTIGEVSTAPASFNVWMGTDGVVAATHYDFHHNTYVQVTGQKRWRLAPPSEALRLRLFPEAHPRDRQSQAGLFAPTCAAANHQCTKGKHETCTTSSASTDANGAVNAHGAVNANGAVEGVGTVQSSEPPVNSLAQAETLNIGASGADPWPPAIATHEVCVYVFAFPLMSVVLAYPLVSEVLAFPLVSEVPLRPRPA